MLKIKLKPTGKIHQRSFRIVVAPVCSKYNGKVTADLGFYTSQTKTLSIDKKELEKWLKNGAQLTEGVDKLLNPDKYPRKKKKTKKDVNTAPKNDQSKDEQSQEEPPTQAQEDQPQTEAVVNDEDNQK
jgi:ribosomal protein S16